MAQINEIEKAERLFSVENAIASQRLEGLEVDAETVADLHRYAAGEMDLATARERVLRRIKADGPRPNRAPTND
jgi:hypothetical protein